MTGSAWTHTGLIGETTFCRSGTGAIGTMRGQIPKWTRGVGPMTIPARGAEVATAPSAGYSSRSASRERAGLTATRAG